MNIRLRWNLALRFKKATHQARVVTEDWVRREMYCINCSRGRLIALDNNAKVIDFRCSNCRHQYQVKATKGRLTSQLPGATYRATRTAIRMGRAPNFLLVVYRILPPEVREVLAIPRHFITEETISRRIVNSRSGKPSRETFVLHLNKIPDDAKIRVVHRGRPVARRAATRAWRKGGRIERRAAIVRKGPIDFWAAVPGASGWSFGVRDFRGYERKSGEGLAHYRRRLEALERQLQELENSGFITLADHRRQKQFITLSRRRAARSA